MNEVSNEEKLRDIYQLLFAMATTNNSFAIENTVQHDEYTIILHSLHTIANELQSLILISGINPPYNCSKNILQLSFVLNNEFKIINFNSEVIKVLNYSPKALDNLAFEKLIALPSIVAWEKLREKFNDGTRFYTTVELVFLTNEHYFLPLYCTFTRLHFGTFFLITSISLVSAVVSPVNPTHLGQDEKLKTELATLVQLRTYILEHLDEPLPTLKKLAILVGSEEHALKAGFRKYYKTSVYHFYHVERLNKALHLILESSLSLKEIAFMCGFSTYLNFYKAFRKHFNYTPSSLSRPVNKK